MNKRPVYYMQSDPRWKNKPYRVTGETSTIGSAGCGPSCAAMLIETITGKTFTPEDACAWSIAHGYKALRQGTYYSYFVPQFKAFNIACTYFGQANSYGNAKHPNHLKAVDYLQQGYYVIALMGPGTWTTGGHFVVLWWEDDKAHVNDPASTKPSRTLGDLQTFRKQAKHYWAVDARNYNQEDDDMFDINKLTDEQVKQLANRMQNVLGKDAVPATAGSEWEAALEWNKRVGVIRGNTKGEPMFHAFSTRQALLLTLYRLLGKEK